MKSVLFGAAVGAAIGNSLVAVLQLADRVLTLSLRGYEAFAAITSSGNHWEWAVAMGTCAFVISHIGERKP